VSVCTNTDGISDGIADGSKSLAGFSNFFCVHFNYFLTELPTEISSEILLYIPPQPPPPHFLLFSSSPFLPCSPLLLFSLSLFFSHLYLAFRRILLFWW